MRPLWTQARQRAAQPVRFAVGGALAAAVHWVLAITIEGFGASAGLANVIGFAGALPVSFFFHQRVTFARSQARRAQVHRMTRHVVVASLGLLVNLLLCAALLQHTAWPFPWCLGVALVAAALGTYALSQGWVFR
ncbi:MAG: GtrA family protein [Rubrivivax sp.]|nr:GtrA family protein [Rubrivivax sp.]